MLSVMTSGVCFTVRRHFFTNQCLILISLLCVSKLWLIAGESNGKSNTEANYNKEINGNLTVYNQKACKIVFINKMQLF